MDCWGHPLMVHFIENRDAYVRIAERICRYGGRGEDVYQQTCLGLHRVTIPKLIQEDESINKPWRYLKRTLMYTYYGMFNKSIQGVMQIEYLFCKSYDQMKEDGYEPYSWQTDDDITLAQVMRWADQHLSRRRNTIFRLVLQGYGHAEIAKACGELDATKYRVSYHQAVRQIRSQMINQEVKPDMRLRDNRDRAGRKHWKHMQ